MKWFLLKVIARIFKYLKSIEQYVEYETIRKKYQIPLDFRFNGENIHFYGKGKLVIGENSYIGRNSNIQIGENQIVKIGNNCSISHNVYIYTVSNLSNQNFDTSRPKKKKKANVTIGNGVWIGANVFINPGVNIGDNVIVGANSVVTKDLSSNTIYGGVPAKFINDNLY
ncbi:acyltransferase [Aureivirga sp. CE67]|uniref:acyltransferase n=1 Tax=Aureivirga sp. CE67 TaxID=1788983 RepID=UPI0018CB571B|nr:acyltransferase [Aureivirga sp. CE67]